MKKIFYAIWVSVACVAVMLLTALCILAFYVTIAFRKIFVKDFRPNAMRSADDEDARIVSAQSQLNAIQATFEKTPTARG